MGAGALRPVRAPGQDHPGRRGRRAVVAAGAALGPDRRRGAARRPGRRVPRATAGPLGGGGLPAGGARTRPVGDRRRLRGRRPGRVRRRVLRLRARRSPAAALRDRRGGGTLARRDGRRGADRRGNGRGP